MIMSKIIVLLLSLSMPIIQAGEMDLAVLEYRIQYVDTRTKFTINALYGNPESGAPGLITKTTLLESRVLALEKSAELNQKMFLGIFAALMAMIANAILGFMRKDKP